MKLISGFRHIPGVHCGTTAMRDLLLFVGLDFSEAMCLGLSSGLGFTYFRNPRGTPPSHIFYGRTATLEHDLCAHLALDFEAGTDENADRAWRNAKDWIDRGVPLLLHVELSQLPYYHTRTPFPGHRVVLVGYDDAWRRALLADTGLPGLQQVSYETLVKARTAQIPPILLHNEWLVIKSALPRVSVRDAVVTALRDNALAMDLDRAPHLGIMGMETLAEDFENWTDVPDWVLCAKFAYQNIEVRGTGGGFFRKMYAQFLREAETIDKRLRGVGLAETMEQIADEWSAFGKLLRRIAAGQDRAAYAQASRAMRRLAMREENFWGKVIDTVGRT